jgi:hypothetical protein
LISSCALLIPSTLIAARLWISFPWLAQKGVLGAIVSLPDNKQVVITNAHMDAGGTSGRNVQESKERQLQQIFTLRDKLEQMLTEMGQKILSIFAADANLNSKKLTTRQHEPVINTLLTQYNIHPTQDRKTCVNIRTLSHAQVENKNLDNSKSGGDLLKARVNSDYEQEVSIAEHKDTYDSSDHFPSTLKCRSL